jgi:hypothetical protein
MQFPQGSGPFVDIPCPSFVFFYKWTASYSKETRDETDQIVPSAQTEFLARFQSVMLADGEAEGDGGLHLLGTMQHLPSHLRTDRWVGKMVNRWWTT